MLKHSLRNINRINIHLDKLKESSNDVYIDLEEFPVIETPAVVEFSARLEQLLNNLSATSKSRPILRPEQIADSLSKFPQFPFDEFRQHPDVLATRELENYWLLVAKATMQTLGVVSNLFLNRTLTLSDEILYWDDVLDSSWYTGLHMIQTSPLALWHILVKIGKGSHFTDCQSRYPTAALYGHSRFYGILSKSRYPRILGPISSALTSPFMICRWDITRKKYVLKEMRNAHASAMGLLMDQCALFKSDNHVHQTKSEHKLEDVIFRSVMVIESLLQSLSANAENYNCEEILAAVDRRIAEYSEVHPRGLQSVQQIDHLGRRLLFILREFLPAYTSRSATVLKDSGRPSRLVRYWFPASLMILSASTSLRILSTRRHDIIQWVRELGTTITGFWNNWVLDPIIRLVGTIRHDEKSEIALMSKNSLEADRASLERMVVDFIVDRGASQDGDIAVNMHDATIKVHEGDLTPVLKAYEKDLRTPFIGTVRGDLVRALLIQIQKTKVDVEIAIGGIDTLLKSQELVFGYAEPLK